MKPHIVFIARQDGNTLADCLGRTWAREWTGLDKSSLNAANSAALQHESTAA